VHYLVVNPVAGRGRARLSYKTVQAFFENKGWPLSTFFTKHPKQATSYVKGLPHNATVLVLGGDGTLNEVAAACVNTKRILGVLPAGSGDDFAYALGIPRNNLTAALNVIETGAIRLVDTGSVNGQTFINAFGVGFDADVAYNLSDAPTFLKHKAAYYYTLLTTLRGLKCSPVTVMVDGAAVYQGPALLVACQNGPRTGSSFLFAPEAQLDDGLLDIVVAGSLNRLETVALVPQVAKGKHLNHPKVLVFKGRDVRLEWTKPKPGHMEGELLVPNTNFNICLQAQSLRVLAPT